MNKEIQDCFANLRAEVTFNLQKLLCEYENITQTLLDDEVVAQYEQANSQNELIHQYLSETEGTNFEKMFTKDEIKRSFGKIMQLSEFGVYHPEAEIDLANYFNSLSSMTKSNKTIFQSYHDIFEQAKNCLSKISEVTKILKDDFLDKNEECQNARRLLEHKAIIDFMKWSDDSNKNPFEGVRLVIEICKKYDEEYGYNFI